MKPTVVVLACTFIGLTLFLGGCGTTDNAQNRFTTPSPLRDQTRFALEVIDMSSMTIDDLAEKKFLISRQPQQIASWDADKAAIRENFSKAARETAQQIGLTIIDATGESPFVIRPVLISIASGGYRPFMVSKSRVKLKVTVSDRSGKVVEEFLLESAVAFDLVGPQASLGGRLRLVASDLGRQTTARLQKLTKH